jgi:hypothetical protein
LIRLKSDQRFLWGDLNWKPREDIAPPGLDMGTFRKNLLIITSRRSRVLLMGLL